MFRRLLYHPLTISFAKYMLAGGVGFLLDYMVLAVCFECFGWHYLLSSALGFVSGLFFVYICSNKWVFTRRSMADKVAAEFLIFLIIGVIGLGLTLLFMWLFVDVAGIYPLISKLVTTAIVLLWNFGARKIILYS